ncbi:FAD/NAD-P-binding domain-containing protein [Athelia psychrophila]|uniref:FAD/NAD-P-binding domain-containing protein n=1 Tax=Athelia psychrophila TaxID=1759441 RepID=A0A167U0P1_9AGAM|nr:FAD/NAD-P-binding domain-containing protein [Fibularhizoctonia sp. CBS 109695]
MAKTVGIIGAGAAGLVTAHTLLQDGFDVTVLTRDPSPGGVWCKERLYPNILINNVNSEYRFSALPMPERPDFKATGGRLSGEDMRGYMESYADRFVKNSIRYNVEVLRVQRVESGSKEPNWAITFRDRGTGAQGVLKYDKLVLCTGGCSQPLIPASLSPTNAAFDGIIVHSSEFRSRLSDITSLAETSPGRVVVVGGGKSAMDIAAYLTNQGLKVTVVFETTDGFLASPMPLPDFVRKSRLMSLLSPHIVLKTPIERFFHTTWLGSAIVLGFWSILQMASLFTFNIAKDSPLRKTRSLFLSVRANDEGVGRPNSFYDLVNRGKIELAAPARMASYGPDRKSVLLNDGRVLAADAVILATGFKSSWGPIFDDATKQELGLGNYPPPTTESEAHHWDYTTLAHTPPSKQGGAQWASSLYRGVVPAKNILRRDFAVNGAVFSANNGLVFETASHWISSYFLEDAFLRVPSSPKEAFESTDREGAYLRKRHPEALLWMNESYSVVKFFTWPQFIDDLFEDMGVPTYRSGVLKSTSA